MATASNHLTIPYKRTTIPPIKQAVREYLENNELDAHPDAFDWDTSQWEHLRAEVSNVNLHVSAIDDFLKYHAHLVLLLTKFPVDINISISYHNAFQSGSPPIILTNLAYERVCLLFNLAALLSQLADCEDRATAEGIKRATAYYQNAAGTLGYLIDNALQPYLASLTGPPPSPDLSQPVLKSLQSLMLAQAQECYWQKAVMDNYRNSTIARLAKQVSLYYAASLEAIHTPKPPVHKLFPARWVPHLKIKQYHFEAAAQFRRSMDDSEIARYGLELARLAQASQWARRGIESQHPDVARPVIQDIQTLSGYIDTQSANTQRDNDLIYHQAIPPLSSLDPIDPAALVVSATLGGLKDPDSVLREDQLLFTDLTTWGARLAIDIYNDRKSTVISDMREDAEQLDLAISRKLQDLSLPTSLDMLDRPLDLPPSFLGKAQEVRSEDGPRRIRGMIEDVQKLAAQDRILLNATFDLLDAELEDDELQRKTFGTAWTRPPSSQANQHLLHNSQTYNEILEKGEMADQIVRDNWAEWEDRIETLVLDEDSLASVIPGSGRPGTRISLSSHSVQTQAHARFLRQYLEQLDDIRRGRQQALNRAHNLASGDDIAPRIRRMAAGLERWAQVKPEMFEEAMAEELSKYDRFKNEIMGNESKQQDLLGSVEERNRMFLQAKRDDPNVKARERTINDLDAAHAKYREIIRNLKEGLDFYNGLSVRLVELRDSAAGWSNSRRQDLDSFAQSLNALSLERQKQQQRARPLPVTGGSIDNEEIPTQPSLSPPSSSPNSTPSSPPPSSPPSRGSKRDRTTPRGIIATASGPSPPAIADLPSPDSNQWESLPIGPLPPSAPGASTSPDVTRARAKGKHTSSSPVPMPGHMTSLVPLSTSPALVVESPTLKSNKAKKTTLERHVF